MLPLSFHTVLIAIVEIFLMGLVGFCLVKSKVVDAQGLKLLSWISVNVSFPFFIFNQIVSHFDPSAQARWWSYPLINIGLGLTGLLVASLFAGLFHKQHRREWMAVAGFHNAGYIPLLLVATLPFGEKAASLYSYVILTIIGFDLCLWTVGVWLITYRQRPSIKFSNFITPPLMSMFAAFAVVLLGWKVFLPDVIMKPVKIMGDSALAIAMLTIGGNLALTTFKQVLLKEVSGALVIKLLVLPVLAFIFLHFVHVAEPFGFILMMQACMPTSITLSVIARYSDSPHQDFINQTIFLTHVLCALTIPLFLGLYGQWVH